MASELIGIVEGIFLGLAVGIPLGRGFFNRKPTKEEMYNHLAKSMYNDQLKKQAMEAVKAEVAHRVSQKLMGMRAAEIISQDYVGAKVLQGSTSSQTNVATQAAPYPQAISASGGVSTSALPKTFNKPPYNPANP